MDLTHHNVIVNMCYNILENFTCSRVPEVYFITYEQFHLLFPLSSNLSKYFINIFAAIANLCGLKQYFFPSLAIAILMNWSWVSWSIRTMVFSYEC